MSEAIGGDPVLSQLLAEDEARYTERASAVNYRAELYVTNMTSLVEAVTA